ncbi:hypothetical protein [Phytobacter massiliensis]|uniref:hypothetical protein n=1 Tax=Phytobacter massiliensis TaxID=1485952 RepID=UPI0002E11E03|nr:hypothetical protein [Phytobacter massiliensis]
MNNRTKLITLVIAATANSAWACNNFEDCKVSLESYRQFMGTAQAETEFQRLGLPATMRSDVEGMLKDRADTGLIYQKFWNSSQTPAALPLATPQPEYVEKPVYQQDKQQQIAGDARQDHDIETVRDHTNAIGTALNNRIVNLNGKVETVKADVAANTTAIKDATAHTDAVGTALNSRIVNLNGKVETVKADVAANTTAIKDATAHTDAVGTAVNSRIDSTRQSVNQVKASVQTLAKDTDSRFADTAERLRGQTDKIDGVAHDVNEANRHTDAVGTALNSRIVNLNGKVETVKADVAANTNAIKDATAHTDAVGTALNSRIDSTRQSVNQVKESVQTLAKDTDSRFADSASQIAATAKTIAENKAEQNNKDDAQDHAVKTASDKASQAQSDAQNATAIATVAEGVAHRLDNASNPRYQSMVAARQQAIEASVPAEIPTPTPAVLNARVAGNSNDSATTTIVKEEVDPATRQQVNDNRTTIQQHTTEIAANSGAIREVRQQQTATGEYVQQMDQVVHQHSATLNQHSAQINENSKRIDHNSKEIASTKQDLKRGLNNAAAMTSLHYHSDNAWALSTGTSNGDGAALAAGVQKGLTEHMAVNVQASSSFDSGWMAGVGLSGDF